MEFSSIDHILTLQENASLIRVVLFMGIILINSLALGAAYGFSATAVVAYANPNTTLLEYPLNENEVSWLASIIVIPIMVSMPLSGAIADMIGRKRTLMIAQMFVLVGWIVVYFAKQFFLLLIGRFLIGLGKGISLPVTIMLNSEIALIKIRGTLSMMSSLAITIGFLYSLIMAATFSLKNLIILSMVPSLIFLLLSIFLPESPMWLMKNGSTDKAKKVLVSLRGSKYNLIPEIKELENLVTKKEDSKWIERMKELKSRNNAIPFMLMAIMMTIQPMCGAEVIVNYTIYILNRAEVEIQHYFLTILVQTGQLLGWIISIFLTTSLKRKVHIALGCLFMGISQAILGFALTVKDFQSDTFNQINKIMLPMSIITTAFGYGVGLGPVPHALLGELLPLKIKSIGTAVIMTLKFTVIFFIIKSFPALASSIGLSAIFWIQSGFCALVCVVSIIILPETQGKTLTELSEMYTQKSRSSGDKGIPKKV